LLSDKVETLAGLREIYLAFNLHTDTPLQDKDVRHAIAYGIRNGSTTGENFAFDMATSSTMSPYIKACTLIGEMLPAIGIDTNCTAMSPDRFLDFLYNPEGDK